MSLQNASATDVLEMHKLRLDRIMHRMDSRPRYQNRSTVVGHIPCLPTEILLHIFKHLRMKERLAFSLACRQFKEIFEIPAAWEDITISGRSAGSERFLQLLGRCRELRRLTIYDLGDLNADSLVSILSQLPAGCRKIRSLQIFSSSYCLDKEVLNALLSTCAVCTNISYLSLPSCRVLLYSHFISLTKLLPKLSKLHLFRSGVTDSSLTQLSGSCLSSLSLSHSEITDTGVLSLPSSAPHLRRLELGGCNISDNGVTGLANGCTGLRHLSLANTEVTDAGIAYLVERCCQIHSLNLSSCRWITDGALVALADACPQLKKLKMMDTIVTDEGIKVLAEGCHKLEKLNLFGCFRITDQALIDLALSATSLASLVVVNCERVTDTGRAFLLEHSSSIQELDYVRKDNWLTGNEPIWR